MSQFEIYQVDIWERELFTTPAGNTTTGREWSNQLDIAIALMLVLYVVNGEEVICSEAWFKSFHTHSILEYVASGGWREQPSSQRYISARAEALRQRGIDVNIWD